MQALRKIFLTLIVTLMFFGIIELIAWGYLSTKPNIYQGDVGYFWSLRPNIAQKVEQEEYSFQLETNELGFRDEKLDESSSERWLFMGCSTTLGWGVEQEKGFVSLLDRHFDDIDVINGGQPGWTTQQALMGIERFKEVHPARVFIGFGVRDSQLSSREDRDARPSPWILSLNTLKILIKMLPKKEQTGDKRRVSESHFERNLRLLKKAFSPQTEVFFYAFPQLERETEYEKIVQNLGGIIPTGFQGGDFFDKDTIHLNQQGNQKLAEWFIANLSPESKKPDIEKKE